MEAMDVKYRPVVFPNGAVKKLKPAAAAVVVAAAGGESVYRECLKNHAASMGGHAVDGCGEFMPSPVANPSDPTSLTCAACGCHRNFHRRLAEGSPSPPHPVAPPVAAALPPPPGLLQGLPHRCDEREDRLPAAEGDEFDSDSDSSDYEDDRSASPPAQPVAAQQPPTYFSSAPHMLLALSSGTPAATSRLHAPVPAAPAPPPPQAAAVARKRFRTKFTSEQKQRMQELSERLGWRLQKRDEAVVEEWCRDIGVHKGVFKVWMHNNKHNFLGGHSARRSATASAAAAGANPSPPPPPSSHTSTAPPNNTTDFNINGAATTPAGDDHHHHAGGHPANGGSPQSS